jgi:hypothetical protein
MRFLSHLCFESGMEYAVRHLGAFINPKTVRAELVEALPL